MNLSQRLLSNILHAMGGMNKKRKEFMRSIFLLLLGLRGRHNFLNLSRYGSYCEKSYRLHYEQDFDFLRFNLMLTEDELSDQLVLAFDPSFLSKSGKQTPHLDRFWSGCLGKATKGLEIGGLAVVDLHNNTAFHLESVQTPGKESLKAKGWSRVDFYAQIIISRYEKLRHLSDYLCVDGFFAKQKFIEPILAQTDLKIICKFRQDANLRYLNNKPKSGKGRPAEYDGKVDLKNIDRSRIQVCYQDENMRISEGVVNSPTLKRNVKLCYLELLKDHIPTGKYVVLFSTDLELDGRTIHLFYKARFQIEFLFRDAKQYTGLTQCEARSENKMHFHHNAALTAINIAKATHHLNQPIEERGPFSMANVKSLYFNEMMLEVILSNLDIDPNDQKIKPLWEKMRAWGRIAA